VFWSLGRCLFGCGRWRGRQQPGGLCVYVCVCVFVCVCVCVEGGGCVCGFVSVLCVRRKLCAQVSVLCVRVFVAIACVCVL